MQQSRSRDEGGRIRALDYDYYEDDNYGRVDNGYAGYYGATPRGMMMTATTTASTTFKTGGSAAQRRCVNLVHQGRSSSIDSVNSIVDANRRHLHRDRSQSTSYEHRGSVVAAAAAAVGPSLPCLPIPPPQSAGRVYESDYCLWQEDYQTQSIIVPPNYKGVKCHGVKCHRQIKDEIHPANEQVQPQVQQLQVPQCKVPPVQVLLRVQRWQADCH